MRVIFLGDCHEFPFDELLGRSREARFRLRGYRLIHTHLKNPSFSQPDLVTLLNERLDMIGLLEVQNDGIPGKFQLAYILPPNPEDIKWKIETYNDLGRVDLNCDELIEDIENDLRRGYYEHGGERDKEGVLLVGFSTNFRSEAEESLKELVSLSKSANKAVLDAVVQTRKQIDP